MSAPMAKRVDDVVFAVVKVTDYLLKGNKIIDDTVIHSLFESIKLNFNSIDSIEKAGLHTFVEDVAKNCMELDSFTVVYGLEVTGWLGGNDVYYRHFKASVHLSFHILWEKLQSKELCDVSVTSALYESLISLTKHKEGLQWIVTDPKMSDVTIEGLTLLTGSSSIFLEKAVLRYLSSVMLELEKLEDETPSACSVLFSSRILNTASENIKNHYNKKHVGPFVPGSLQLLENLCRQSLGTSKHLLTNHVEFCKYLLDMIGSFNARDCDTVLNIIGALLKVGTEEDSCIFIGDQMNHFVGKIEDQLTHLAVDGNVVTAQKLAACCLKSQGTVRLEQSCKAILAQPVKWILQDDVECSVFPEHVLEAAVSTRCRCTNVVCRSLNGNSIGAKTVTDLLRRTIVFSGHEDKSCTRAASYLYKNRNLQRKCLETLLSGTHCRKDEECGLLSRAQTIVELFREPDSETVIYSLCSQLLLDRLPSMFTDENAVSLTVDLGRTIQRHLSALQWELRDTSLELLGRVIEQYKDNTFIIKWMVEHRLHVQIWQCVKDGESYVRASAVSALYQLCLCPQLLSALTESGVVSNEADIIEAVTGIVENDTEAFARRSAVTFLLNLFKVKVTSRLRDTKSSDVQDSSGGIPDSVIVTIIKATRDFDWEVKLVALDFISFIIQQELSQCSKSGRTPSEAPEYAKDLYSSKTADKSEVETNTSCVIERLCRMQVVSVLIDALDDYDDKVSEKAFKVFSDLQSGLGAITNRCKTDTGIGELHEHSELSYSDENVLGIENKDSDLISRCGKKKRKLDDMYRSGTTDSKQDLDTNEQVSLELRTDYLEKNLKKFGHLAELSCITNDRNEINAKCIAKKQEHMLNKILDFDVSIYRSRLEQVNDEAAKLVSLVEDIVTAGDKEEDENAVDCY